MVHQRGRDGILENIIYVRHFVFIILYAKPHKNNNNYNNNIHSTLLRLYIVKLCLSDYFFKHHIEYIISTIGDLGWTTYVLYNKIIDRLISYLKLARFVVDVQLLLPIQYFQLP